MSNELTAKTITDRVTEKLKAEFVSLISDEEWSSLVKSSYDQFFEPTQGSGYNSKKDGPSLFQQIIQTETNAILSSKVRETLANVTEETWGDGKETTAFLIETAIKNAESVLFNSMIGGIADGISQSIAYSIQNQVSTNSNQY